jgi:hypothetical protein
MCPVSAKNWDVLHILIEPMWHLLSAQVGNHFADKRRSLGRYSSLADSTMEFSFLEYKVKLNSHVRFPAVAI